MTPLSPSLWGLVIGAAAITHSFDDYEKVSRLPAFTKWYVCAKEAVILENIPATVRTKGRLFKVVQSLKGKRYKVGDEIDLPLSEGIKIGEKHWHSEGPVAPRGPVFLTPGAVEYVEGLPKLPAKGPERLAIAWKHYKSGDPGMLNESLGLIAMTPHDELFAIKAELKREEILAGLEASLSTPVAVDGYSRMLAVCGTRDDLPAFKKLIEKTKCQRDEMWAAYAMLRGPEALDDFDKRIADPTTKYHDAAEIVDGVCILGTISPKSSGIPRDRVLETLYGAIEEPNHELAVINGLRKLKEWKAAGRLVEFFHRGDDDEGDYVRRHAEVMMFLSECPTPEAKTQVEELKKADPKAWEFYVSREAKFIEDLRKMLPE